MSPIVEERKLNLVEPDWSNPEEVKVFKSMLSEHSDVRGVKTLQGCVDNLLRYFRYMTSTNEKIKQSINYVNGIRGYKARDPLSGLKRHAFAYFSALDTPGLRMQAKLFGIDYNAYDSQEEIIEALVQKNMEMAGAEE